MRDQKGAVPLLLLVATIGIIGVLGVLNFAPFKDTMLSTLFPKDSSFAAAYFDDDFENPGATGFDTTKWTSRIEEGGTPPSAIAQIEDAAAIRGSKGLHIKNPEDSRTATFSIYDDNRLLKKFDPTIDEFYVRFRMKLVSDVVGSQARDFFNATTQQNTAMIAAMGIHSRSSRNQLRIYSPGMTPSNTVDPGINLVPDTEYCLEMHVIRNSPNGKIRAWINDSPTPFFDRVVDTGTLPVSWIWFGSNGGDGGRNVTTGVQNGTISDFYLDDFAMNTTNRIGCGEVIGKKGPVRTNPAPQGFLPQNTTQQVMSISTQTASSCRYYSANPTNLDDRKDYDSITSSLNASADGKTHTVNLTGLSSGSNGTNYRYFVRCKDNTTNEANDDDVLIQFTIGIDQIKAKSFELIPTYQSISVYVPFDGDQNYGVNPAKMTAFWKKPNESNWKQSLDMSVDRRITVTSEDSTLVNPFVNVWRSSVIGLIPNTAYEIKVVAEDNDGAVCPSTSTGFTCTQVGNKIELIKSITTKNDIFSLGSGAKYYVAPNGNDASSGTDLNSPLRTIQAAVNKASAGSSILIRGGTYSEFVTINAKNGSENNWITITPYNNERVILDGQTTVKNAFSIKDSSFIIIKGFEIKDFYEDFLIGTGGFGAINTTKSNNIIIDSNSITGFVWHGIRTQNSNTITIQNNRITRNVDPYPYKPVDRGENPHLIYIGDNDTTVVNKGQFVVRNNTLIDVTKVAPRVDNLCIDFPKGSQYWDAIGGGKNFEIDGFVGRDSDIYGNVIDGMSDDGIEGDGGVMNVRIWGNTIYAREAFSASGISPAPAIIGPLYVFKNLIYNQRAYVYKLGQNSTGDQFYYNNTNVAGPLPHLPKSALPFYDCKNPPPGSAMSASNPGITNLVSRNNIFQALHYVFNFEPSYVSAEQGKTFNFDYDSLYTSGNVASFQWPGVTKTDFEAIKTGFSDRFNKFKQLTNQEPNGMAVDNRNEFVNFLASDFRLKDDSVLKDKGQTIIGFNDPNSSWAYAGSAPDIGAFEIGKNDGPALIEDSINPPPPPPTTPPSTPQPSTPPKVGDIVENNKVDLYDYNALLTDFGKKNDANTKADLDDDNDVDLYDYNILLTNFGR